MDLDIIAIGKIGLFVISITIIILLINARITNRLGNQFFGIMLIFWIGVLVISIKPEILDSVLNNTGFINKAQFLLSASIVIIVYLLINQIKFGRIATSNLNQIVRKIALKNFTKEVKKKKSDVIIVIVAKNEEKTLSNVINKIKQSKISCSYQIIVVNDGSTDRTEEIARNEDVIVVTHHVNLGIGGAVKTGYLASMYLQPKYVISLDADGQHDPSYISKIIEKLNDFDLVYGSRFTKQSEYKTNAVRLLGNKFYSNLVSMLGKTTITDVTSGYRGIRADKIKKILFLAETNFAVELGLRAAKNELKISEIPIRANMRQEGKSQFFKIEKFFIYNFNACLQIINALIKKPNFSSIEYLNNNQEAINE